MRSELTANQELHKANAVDTPILRARRLQAKAKRIMSSEYSYAFRLGALIACDNRPGTFYAQPFSHWG